MVKLQSRAARDLHDWMRHLTDDMRAGMSGHIADGLGLPPRDTEGGCVDREKGTAGTLGLTWFAKFNEHLAIVDTPFVQEVLCSRAGSPPAQEAPPALKTELSQVASLPSPEAPPLSGGALTKKFKKKIKN